MADLIPAPTVQQMREWRDTLNGEWSASSGEGGSSLNSQIEEETNLYFQRFNVDAPYGLMAVKTGSAPSDCDAAVDTLVPNDVLVRVKPARATEKYKKKAEKLIRFGKAMIYAWRRNRDVLRMIVGDMITKRIGVARVLVDQEAWPEAPSDLSEEDHEAWEIKNRRRSPISCERRDPRYVRWRDTADGELLVVVEHYQTTVLEATLVFGRYPAAMRILKKKEQKNDHVWIDDIWYATWRCVLIDDEPIFSRIKIKVEGEEREATLKGVVPHGYTTIPYVLFPFRELPFDEPGRRYRGLLSNAAGLYPIESQVLTMHVWMLAWNAWRTWVTDTIDSRPIEVIPGRTLPMKLRAGESIHMLEGQPVPPELLNTVAVVDSYLQRNSATQGPRTAEGTRSGQQLWAIQSMRQLKLESARKALITGLNRILSLAAMHLETVLREPLTLPLPGRDHEGNDMGEVSVTPQDIDGYWDGFDCSLGRRMDPAELEQAKSLSVLSQNNWMPWRQSVEMSGLTDVPQDWQDELMRQSVARMDFMLEAAALTQLKAWFGEDSEEYKGFFQKVMAAKQGGSKQMPGAPGMPGGGGLQPPGMKGPVTVGGQLSQMMAPRGGRSKGRAGPGRGAPPRAGGMV